MLKKSFFCSIPFSAVLLLCALLILAVSATDDDRGEEGAFVWERCVKKDDRRRLVATEYGEISAVRVAGDSIKGSYLLHFFTLEPNSLLLPVMLHSDMVFYVHTGSGKLSWSEKDELRSTDLRRGDVYRLHQGSVFFLQSNLDTETETDTWTNLESQNDRQKLRIHAIFADDKSGLHGSELGPYTNIRDMVLGFDKKVLQASFQVPGEVIETLFNGTETPAVIHAVSKTNRRNSWEMESEFVRGLLGIQRYNILLDHKKKKPRGPFNLFSEAKDFENCNGWSTMVTMQKLSKLKGSNIGLFMVNLTEGSMMGPHWNPTATEVAVVLQGRGMIRVVCPGATKETACRNTSFEVKEGDVFVVPRFHAMAQMAFNNNTFVFMGFSTSVKNNHPQFFAGRASVLQTLARDVLALAFNVTNTTMDQILAPQSDSVILKCVSCAEENWRILEDKKQRKREEAREREEEASREREEEKRKEEEAKREQERQKEDEARKKQEEESRKQEEEARKRQEEETRKQEEEEARKRQEEETRKREEEEERKRQEEVWKRAEEDARKKQEEEQRRREEEEQRKKQEQERRELEEEARSGEEQRQAAEEERQREKEAQRQREEKEGGQPEMHREKEEGGRGWGERGDSGPEYK